MLVDFVRREQYVTTSTLLTITATETPTLTRTKQAALPTSTVESNLTISWDTAAQDTVEEVYFLLNVAALAVIVLFITFDVLRRHGTLKKLYATRCESCPHETPHFPKKVLGWLGATLSTPESFLLEHVGLDAVMLIRFVRMCLLVCFILSILMLPILSGINYYAYDPNSGSNNSTAIAGNLTLSDIGAMGMTRLSIANVPDGSNLLWAHVAYAYLVTVICFYFLYNTYRDYISLSIVARKSQEDTSDNDDSERRLMGLQLSQLVKSRHSRTVMCTNVPEHLRKERKLLKYFTNLGIGPVESVYIERSDGSKVLRLIRDREKVVMKLEHSYMDWIINIQIYLELKNMDGSKRALVLLVKQAVHALQMQSPTSAMAMSHGVQSIVGSHIENGETVPEIAHLRPKLRSKQLQNFISTNLNNNRDRDTIDAIEFYTEQIQKLTAEIVQARTNSTKDLEHVQLGNVAFVTFEHQSSALIAGQVILGDDLAANGNMRVTFAPHPSDVLWENLSIGNARRSLQRIIAQVVFACLCLFWTFPMSGLASLVNLSALAQVPAFAPLAQKLLQYPKLYRIVETTIPTLCVSLVTLIIPHVINMITALEAYPAASWREKNNLSKYYVFILFNVFFIFALSSAFWLVLSLILSNPGSIIELLAVFIPHGSTFFVNYMLYYTIFSACDLLRFQMLIPFFWKRWRCKTPRDWYQLHAFSSSFAYSFDYSYHLLIFTIALCYSVIAPVIVFPAFLYFTVSFIVWRYKLLFVYTNLGESFGRLWIMVFNRCCFALLLLHLTLMGILTLKDGVYETVFVFFLVPITFLFWRHSSRLFEKHATIVPLDQVTEWSLKKYEQETNDPRHEPLTENSSLSCLSVSATNLSQFFTNRDALGQELGLAEEENDGQEYYHIQQPLDYRNWSLTQKLMRVWLPAGLSIPTNLTAIRFENSVEPTQNLTVRPLDSNSHIDITSDNILLSDSEANPNVNTNSGDKSKST